MQVELRGIVTMKIIVAIKQVPSGVFCGSREEAMKSRRLGAILLPVLIGLTRGVPRDEPPPGRAFAWRECDRSPHARRPAAGMMLVCTAASAIPALRNVHIDPLRALRHNA
jgi:hypothetical protein